MGNKQICDFEYNKKFQNFLKKYVNKLINKNMKKIKIKIGLNIKLLFWFSKTTYKIIKRI